MLTLNDDGCLRLLTAVVLQWWREADQDGDAAALAGFLGISVDEIRGVRQPRIDVWRRKRYVAARTAEERDDVYF